MTRKIFTPLCYSIAKILRDADGQAVNLTATEQKVVDRMVRYGWLKAKIKPVPMKAGLYEYMARCQVYSLTKEGQLFYNRIADHINGRTAEDIRTDLKLDRAAYDTVRMYERLRRKISERKSRD